MNEFARMIYKQWRNKDDNDIDWGNYNEVVGQIHDFLSENIAEDLECTINRQVWKV